MNIWVYCGLEWNNSFGMHLAHFLDLNTGHSIKQLYALNVGDDKAIDDFYHEMFYLNMEG